ncbi:MULTISPECIES: HpcH/HpaI aldolase/citrate lyase family protein [Pseudomonas]|uniref:Citrate lyase n=1 Tax=Pseudomonas lundensis TaxID=86185 RepID=A0A266N565_9PSED|nr:MULTISPECIES: HpcH/HpaI aldolase/citrate lyase family protein [Pseudomonas]NMY38727.1 HpcH/HpaI aldolase/citrate lyase family protein [Pseudomonas sp. WS 5078]NMY61694.1 HpcH/HpaI aldolase/citrate lyase family protein [Pseudomonas sp. WS 5354]OZY57644.1 citrate lyase [Pseudomonas lundensis]
MIRHSAYALGATLYMPATRPDILDVVFGEKIQGLRSLVVCLEDAVAETDVQQALINLKNLLLGIEARGGRLSGGPILFVRPRDAEMAAVLNEWSLMRHVDGFVVPKLRLSNIRQWQQAVTRNELALMPTLETPEVFDPGAMVELRDAMLEQLPGRIIALRIGGNDLMGCLGLRRNPAMTLYSTPMSYVIPMLCGVMGAAGFALTAPVFEQLNTPHLLEQELALDMAHGLVGKTAIHPSQISVIHKALQVTLEDLNSARQILSESAPAVFKFNDAMCEPATHYKWAQTVIERAHWQGVRTECGNPSDTFGGSLRLAELVG